MRINAAGRDGVASMHIGSAMHIEDARPASQTHSSRSRMRGGFPNEVDRRELCRVYAHKLGGSQATRPIQRKGSVPRQYLYDEQLPAT